MSQSTPRILAILPGFMPSTLMCVVRPLLGLQQAGRICFRVALEAYFDAAELRWADLVVFCRNVEPRYAYILDAVLTNRLPYVYDIDDNLYEVPANIADGEYYRSPERAALLTRYLRSADLVRVYSAALLESIRPLNERTLQVAAVLDWRLIRSPGAPRDDKVKIVYTTSRHDDHLFSIFTPALKQVMQDYAGRVEAHFLGFIPPEFRGRPGVHHQRYDSNYERYMRRFSSAGYDIGLAPMLDDPFHRAKTNNKFREYSASGIAGVYSNVPLYSSWVEDGQTGLLVENQADAWYAALAKLIEDADLRQRISCQAQERVRQLYSEERFEQVWWEQIQSILRSPMDKTPAQAVSVQPTAELTMGSASVPAPSRMQIWQKMFQRGIARMTGGELGRVFFYLRFHLENLWWLFKVNWLKRL